MKELFSKFLHNSKFAKEFELFLEQYKILPPGTFAIIKISGATLEKHIESIAEDIAFLNKFGLYPLIVHGAGSALDKVVNNAKINGIRCTSNDDIGKVENISSTLSARLIEAIENKGSSAVSLSRVLECEFLDKDIYGNVGKITGINKNKIIQAVKDGKTPVFSNIGYSKDALPLNMNADYTAQKLFEYFTPKRLFFITDTGGVLDKKGKIIQHINLSDFNSATDGMLFKLETIKEIIRKSPNSAIVIGSADSLAKEVFTIQGSGTYISNFKICKSDSKNDVDKNKLRDLLNSSFNKILSADYFDDEIKCCYHHNEYKAVAIIKTLNEYDYLCKFAVAPTHQGTGLAKYIWEILIKEHPKLVWRSKSGNSANNFYNSRCNGMVKIDGWNVYWYGHKYLEQAIINEILNIPETFIDEGAYETLG